MKSELRDFQISFPMEFMQTKNDFIEPQTQQNSGNNKNITETAKHMLKGKCKNTTIATVRVTTIL